MADEPLGEATRVRLPADLRKQLQAESKQTGLSMSDIIRLRLRGLELPQRAAARGKETV